MKRLLLLIPLLICGFGQAQEKPAESGIIDNGITSGTIELKPLTPDEKNAISRAEVKLLQDQQAREKAIAQLDQQLQQDSAALQRQIDAVYTARKLKQTEWSLCEGPGEPLCKDAAMNDLTLQPKPAPVAENKPAEGKSPEKYAKFPVPKH
jgi:hypothetical protein